MCYKASLGVIPCLLFHKYLFTLFQVPLSADTKRNPEQKRVSSVKEFLVLSGLPMYTERLLSNGCDTLNSLASMNEDKLRSCGVTDPLHIEIIVSAINSTWNTETLTDQIETSSVHNV